MKRNVTSKLIIICLLGVLLLIPLLWVGSIIDERKHYKQQAFNDVTQMWTGQQLVAGPFVVQDYSLKVKHRVWNKESQSYETEYKTVAHQAIILPEQLKLHGNVETQTRQRGIYEVPVYTGDLQLSGQFSNQSLLDLKTKHQQSIRFGDTRLVMPIRDMRGIKGQPKLTMGGKTYAFKPGTQIKHWSDGLHAPLPGFNTQQITQLAFQSQLALRGSRNLSVLPTGKHSDISLKANWQHPSFQGRLLPEQRTINNQGFDASWSTSPYSSDMQAIVETCVQETNCQAQHHAVGVDLIQPVDAHSQADRSTKYGLLFIALTFAAFFLFEVLKQLPIHPIQYTMVGLSLALFFLLLISLSEHMQFALAYSLSALACIGLLGSYISAVLKSKQRGLLFAGGLTGLYSFIYVIISSEDYALMMGAVLLFSALGAVMLLTRHIDWYQMTPSKSRAELDQYEMNL